MGMKLRSTAPESTLVFESKTDTRPLCEFCGEPVNTEYLMDPAHDSCWEGVHTQFEPTSLLELWASEVSPNDVDYDLMRFDV